MKVIVDGPMPRGLGILRPDILAAARYFAARSSKRIGRAFGNVTVILQDDTSSALVHLAINGAKGATDVVTQPYDPMPGEMDGICGELYVNCEQACRAAPNRPGWSVRKELLLYIAHGMDHLSGADDHSPADYARMRRRELGWIRDFDA